MAKILIVDDDPNYLKSVQELLSESGPFEPETCSDPRQALEKLQKTTYDCLLLDYNMPGLDGQDLLGLIRARKSQMPIIICTGYTESQKIPFRREGAFEVLEKPVPPELLLETLGRALSSEEETTPVLIKGYNLKEARSTVTRKLIVKALSKTEFNVSRAAKLLGMSRQAVMNYMKRFQISR